MSADNHSANPRKYMELAVDTMTKSKSEIRYDKSSPLVGAVLIMADGRIEKACRGELSDGDHAEYTLLERKLSSADLTGSTLYVTLEPCAPGARSISKSSCAERIINRRVAKVWVGIEDPDPLVDRRGIQYLLDNGVDVELFDRDLQESIRLLNSDFIKSAEERASRHEERSVQESLSVLEKPILSATLDDFSSEEIELFINLVEDFKFAYHSDEFIRVFTQLNYLAKCDDAMHPTGLGILLFGRNPQIFFPHAVIRATYNTAGRKEDIATFSGSLPKQARDSLDWFKNAIGKQSDRSGAQRIDIYDYPLDVVRESVNNALVHRSYEVEGAAVHFEIRDDAIIIRSPGGPVKPISMERMSKLDAPFLSKNPKITYAFEKLRLCENRGLGFKTIRSLPSEYNLPLPTATYDEPFLTFLFPRAYGMGINDKRLSTLSNAEVKGFDYIRLNSPITRKVYEEYFGLSQKTAERHLGRLTELNLIKRIGSGPKTSYELIE